MPRKPIGGWGGGGAAIIELPNRYNRHSPHHLRYTYFGTPVCYFGDVRCSK